MGLFGAEKQYVSKQKYEGYKESEDGILKALPGIFSSFRDGIKIEGGWPFENDIPRNEMDGSLESVKKLDEYLGKLHVNKESISQQQMMHVILSAGAYVCEVIRSESNDVIGTVRYSDLYIRKNKITEIVEFDYFTALLLQNDKTNSISMPYNKIGRLISDGPDDSVWYFSVCELKSK